MTSERTIKYILDALQKCAWCLERRNKQRIDTFAVEVGNLGVTADRSLELSNAAKNADL